MRCCLCLFLAIFTTNALGSLQYYQGEGESDSCDDEDFVYEEEEEGGCLDCQVEGDEEASIAVSKRSSGRREAENAVLKTRWT